MNAPIPETGKPARIALDWLPSVGFYILATDSVRRSFLDPDDAVAAIREAIDPRLDDMPRGNC